MKSVLIIDNDKAIIEMVSTVLTMNDINAYGISKGAQVYDWINELKPDVILLDIYLDDSDGRALCFDLKTVDKYKGIPVILYSAGYITDKSVSESLANDFIVKPFDIHQLVNKIERLIANPNGHYVASLQSLNDFTNAKPGQRLAS